MLPLKLEDIMEILKEFSCANNPLEIILLGGLSMQHYGLAERTTVDLDGEVKGNVDALFRFLKNKNIPSDIGEDISGWSIISMPPGYRERAIKIYSDDKLIVKVLNPVDFIVAKLRRFTEVDLNDALFVAKRFNVKPEDISSAVEDAIKNSPKDTSIFTFKKYLTVFIDKLRSS